MCLLPLRDDLKGALRREISRQMNNHNNGDIQIFSLHVRKHVHLVISMADA